MLQSLGARVPEACLHVRQCCTHPAAVCNVLRPCQLLASQQAGNSAVRLLSRGTARARVRTHAQSLEEVREDVMAQRRALREFPTAAYGQVISAQANFVRVNISHLDTSASIGRPCSALNSLDEQADASSDDGSLTQSSSDDSQQIAARLASNSQASTSSSSNGSCTAVPDSDPDLAPPRTQLLCTVRALLKKINQRVLVGDRVRVHGIDWAEGRGVVESVEQRNSELADPAIANVEHVLLLFGLTQPPFEPAQVSRFLVSVSASGLPVTLALNKCDLLPASEVQERLDQVASWGYNAIAVSCETGQGLDLLAQRLADVTSVVAGPSGAGKSSLINALRLGKHKPEAEQELAWGAAAAAAGVCKETVLQQQQQLEVGCSASAVCQQQQIHVSVTDRAGRISDTEMQRHDQHHQNGFSPLGSQEDCSSSSSNGNSSNGSGSSTLRSPEFLTVGEVSKIGRGKHTTRTVTLIELPFGGLMADTPGFNQPTLDRVSSAELASLFPEFNAAREAQGGCRFTDCMHLAEPGCAVTAHDFERYEHYVKFLAEIKVREDYDVRVMQLAKQRREGAMKVVTGKGGVTRYEARLDSKKHRNTSRRRIKQNLWDQKDE